MLLARADSLAEEGDPLRLLELHAGVGRNGMSPRRMFAQLVHHVQFAGATNIPVISGCRNLHAPVLGGVIGLSLAHALASKRGWSSVALLSSDENPKCAAPFAANARSIVPDLEVISTTDAVLNRPR